MPWTESSVKRTIAGLATLTNSLSAPQMSTRNRERRGAQRFRNWASGSGIDNEQIRRQGQDTHFTYITAHYAQEHHARPSVSHGSGQRALRSPPSTRAMVVHDRRPGPGDHTFKLQRELESLVAPAFLLRCQDRRRVTFNAPNLPCSRNSEGGSRRLPGAHRASLTEHTFALISS